MTDFQVSLLLFAVAAVAINGLIYGGIAGVYFRELKRAPARPTAREVATPATPELSAAHALEEWRSLREAA